MIRPTGTLKAFLPRLSAFRGRENGCPASAPAAESAFRTGPSGLAGLWENRSLFTALLIAAFGSQPDRYQTGHEVQCNSGIAPVVASTANSDGFTGAGPAPSFAPDFS